MKTPTKTSSGWLILAITLLGAALVPLLAHSWKPSPRPGVDMDILVDGVVQRIIKQSHGTHYLPVRRIGVEYTIRIRNRNHHRIEAVLSVDGLSVINGRPVSGGTRGYLIEAGQTVEIPGWRRGSEKVAAFEFTRLKDSYAYRMGRPEGIGSIRLAAYAEKRPVVVPTHRKKRSAESNLQSDRSLGHRPNSKTVRREQVGTGYGRELDHRVDYVYFDRSHLAQSLTIKYGQGRPVRPVPQPRRHPDNEDFAPPPPGYRPSS